MYDFRCVCIYAYIYTPACMNVILFKVSIVERSFHGIVLYLEKDNVKVKFGYIPSCNKLLPEFSKIISAYAW